MATSTPDWRNEIERTWIFADGSPAFDFDTVINERHSSILDVTDNPVETGVVISDHAFMKPRSLEIFAYVSDVWLGMRESDEDKVGPLNPDKPWLIPAESGDTSRRSARAYQLLLGLQASAVPFAVQTGLRVYQNMLCLELEANQDKDTASTLAFRAVLREIQIVGTQTVIYPPRAAGKPTNQASKKTTGGEKQAVPPPPAKVKSILLQAGQATFGGG